MKKLVIIGGGFAGAYIARKLERFFDVTLIDTKSYFEFTPSVLRTLVEPDHVKSIQQSHHRYLQKTRVIQGHVIDIQEHGVKTSHEKFPFDYLVICSGSHYTSPIKEENLAIVSRTVELRQFFQKLQKAQTILLIGGGIVGVELAAELVTHFQQKKITMVHAHDNVMERMPSEVSDYAKKFLTARGVQIIYNNRVNTNHGKTYYLARGEKITPDIAFLCTGITPCSDFLEKNFPSLLTDKKYVKVTKTLQVEGQKHMFAAGDVTSIREEKTAQNAEKQAQAVAENIVRAERGEVLVEYHSKPRVMVISLGRWNGILTYKNVVLTGIIPGILKTMIEWKTMWRYR